MVVALAYQSGGRGFELHGAWLSFLLLNQVPLGGAALLMMWKSNKGIIALLLVAKLPF